MKTRNIEQQQAISELRKILKPGGKVYAILRHVSSSGMSRRIDFYTIQRNEPRFLTGYISKALGLRHEYRKGGLVVGGCGMDMGFHVVYELSRTLFPKGFIPAKAGRHGRNGTPDTERDMDGGYALQNYWL